jgi:ATP-dependent protease HslVU (ClpYQ) peptidase subunit
MTLCMAALCRDEDQNELVVVAADRMVTFGGFIEFEHSVPKMANQSPYALALIAGDTLLGTRLAKAVAAEFDSTSPRVAEIADRMAARYVDMRRNELENQVLAPRGLDLGSFYGNHAGFNAQITMMLDQTMAQFNLGVELLIAGVDAAGAHIYSVHNPGRPEREYDVIGYAAIGSGGIHALQAMIGFKHAATASVAETVFRVYASKRRAEVAPGVGLDTDIAIVSASGVRFLSADTLSELAVLYDNYGKAAEEAQVKELSKLTLAENGPAT